MFKYLPLFLVLLCGQTAFSQDVPPDSVFTKPLWVREVPRYDAVLGFGFLEPTGDYADVARSGLNIGAGVEYHATRKLGISFTGRYIFQDFGFKGFESGEGGGDAHKQIVVAAGPLVSLPFGRFQIDAYGRGGLMFLNNPDQVAIREGQGANLFLLADRSSSTATYLDAGVRFIYYFRTNVQLFVAPGFMTTLGDPVTYLRTTEVGNSTRFRVNPSNFYLNLGLKISLGKRYSNGELLVD